MIRILSPSFFDFILSEFFLNSLKYVLQNLFFFVSLLKKAIIQKK